MTSEAALESENLLKLLVNSSIDGFRCRFKDEVQHENNLMQECTTLSR